MYAVRIFWMCEALLCTDGNIVMLNVFDLILTSLVKHLIKVGIVWIYNMWRKHRPNALAAFYVALTATLYVSTTTCMYAHDI